MGRRRFFREEGAEVSMAPLIDCVFLLLIFFLVTTMIKRKEKLVPVKLPDTTSQISAEPFDASILLGVDRNGKVSIAETGRRNAEGELEYAEIPDLAAHLAAMAGKDGPSALERPLRIDADRDLEFQRAAEILDICKIQGFSNVGIRTRQRAR